MPQTASADQTTATETAPPGGGRTQGTAESTSMPSAGVTDHPGSPLFQELPVLGKPRQSVTSGTLPAQDTLSHLGGTEKKKKRNQFLLTPLDVAVRTGEQRCKSIFSEIQSLRPSSAICMALDKGLTRLFLNLIQAGCGGAL